MNLGLKKKKKKTRPRSNKFKRRKIRAKHDDYQLSKLQLNTKENFRNCTLRFVCFFVFVFSGGEGVCFKITLYVIISALSYSSKKT